MGQHIKHSDSAESEGWNTGRCVTMECLRGYARLQAYDAITSQRLTEQCRAPQTIARCSCCGSKRLRDGDAQGRCYTCIMRRRRPSAIGNGGRGLPKAGSGRFGPR